MLFMLFLIRGNNMDSSALSREDSEALHIGKEDGVAQMEPVGKDHYRAIGK